MMSESKFDLNICHTFSCKLFLSFPISIISVLELELSSL